jgi:acyl-CoA thioester hydrolase
MTFNREVSAGDLIEVRSRVLEIGDSALRVYHEMLHAETNETVAVSTLTEAHLDSSTRKPCPLPPEIQRRPSRDANITPRALEFALPGQW